MTSCADFINFCIEQVVRMELHGRQNVPSSDEIEAAYQLFLLKKTEKEIQKKYAELDSVGKKLKELREKKK